MTIVDYDNSYWKQEKYKIHKSVNHLPLYVNNKFTGEYVTYIADLPYEHFEIVTDKTYYYDVDFRKQYVLIDDDKITVNNAYNFNDFINENYYKRSDC